MNTGKTFITKIANLHSLTYSKQEIFDHLNKYGEWRTLKRSTKDRYFQRGVDFAKFRKKRGGKSGENTKAAAKSKV